jgi:hypothetical protein
MSVMGPLGPSRPSPLPAEEAHQNGSSKRSLAFEVKERTIANAQAALGTVPEEAGAAIWRLQLRVGPGGDRRTCLAGKMWLRLHRLRRRTWYRCASGCTHLSPVLPPVPRQRELREMVIKVYGTPTNSCNNGGWAVEGRLGRAKSGSAALVLCSASCFPRRRALLERLQPRSARLINAPPACRLPLLQSGCGANCCRVSPPGGGAGLLGHRTRGTCTWPGTPVGGLL